MTTRGFISACALLLASLACAPLGARAEVAEYTWTYSVDGDAATITGLSPDPTGAVVVPDSLGGKSVTGIGAYAFCLRGELTSVTIPASVTRLGDRAFAFCGNLSEVVFEGGVSGVGVQMVFAAFEGTPWLETFRESLPPPANDDFGAAATISGASGVTTGTIVGATIDDGGSFADGDGGEVWWKWTAPADGVAAFDTHGSGYDTTIAVYTGDSLATLTLIAENDDDDGAGDKTSLVEFRVNAGTTCFIAVGGYGIGDIVLNWSVRDDEEPDDGGEPGAGEEKFEMVVEDGVVIAYGGVCPSVITADDWPEGVTGIGNSAFSYCVGLEDVTIPDSVTRIGNSAFADCAALKRVTLPGSVTSVGEGAFHGCRGLADADGLVVVGGVLYDYFGTAEEVAVPDSVTSVGANAFYGLAGLKRVTLPASVTSIQNAAFCGCAGLTEVMLPAFVTRIGASAFESCSGLTDVTIPGSVTNIGVSAFYSCGGLASVTMTGDCPAVDEDAFGEVGPSCVARLPRGNDTYVVAADGKWQGMPVEYLAPPDAVFADLAALAETFGEESETVAHITDAAALDAFNAFLAACGVTAAEQLTEAQKPWAYRSFRLAEIAETPALYEAEPKLRIAAFRPAGEDWAATVTLAAGEAPVAMNPVKVAARIRVGTSPDVVDATPVRVSAPDESAASLTFVVGFPENARGFLRVAVE